MLPPFIWTAGEGLQSIKVHYGTVSTRKPYQTKVDGTWEEDGRNTVSTWEKDRKTTKNYSDT